MGIGNQFFSTYVDCERPMGEASGDVLGATRSGTEERAQLESAIGSLHNRGGTEPLGVGEVTHECVERDEGGDRDKTLRKTGIEERLQKEAGSQIRRRQASQAGGEPGDGSGQKPRRN